ncbi:MULTISPECIES: phage tail protein I [unclassified Sphingobium]|uniref:phage tail protein I n=1 Tax=unclassified Sphingobium TaxID=2611147 RepID=UPI002223FF13|nr:MULTISPECIES: phage tail protein I [unclassified Sphingobium]MCW2395175.1 phage tail P2-like protein [Sphingobium sp. B8D3B]MCW2418689.1 phage tail P2-like protein [Sphingobium sp. B8D3C]
MSLLPPNASALELGLEAAVTGQALPVPLRALWSPQSCPEALLPWLAWALSVDEWDASWPVSVRRQVVASAIAVHRRKGTLAAVRAAVAALGGSISIREWWETEPMGEPGTFSLILALSEVNGAAPGAAYVDATIRQVERAKPLSRPFDFTLAIAAAGAIGIAPYARAVVSARLDMAA